MNRPESLATPGTAAMPPSILILDDSAADREMLRRFLAADPSRDYHIHVRSDIEAALAACQELQPDCILVDYALEDGSGLDFLRELQPGVSDGTCPYPVVMLTGSGSEEIAAEAFKHGARDYLVKGRLTPELLQRTVAGVLYQAATERTLREQRAEVDRLLWEAQQAHARKDQFLAALSHELRTPLAPILLAVSASRPAGLSPEETEEIFDVIRRNVELEARLIDDLLDLTRISHGKLRLRLAPVDAHAVLRHALETCRAEIEAKRLRLTLRFDAGATVVQADPARLQQVFWSLLKNAVKFTPSDGEVRVETRNPAPGQLEVAVSDSGIGIEAAALTKIFDAFEQGSPEVTQQFGGLGLGLAIARALMEAHGGCLHATSEGNGHGARFFATLAATPGEPRAAVQAPVRREGTLACFSRYSVLLVEDHPDSARLLSRIMERHGLRVVVAHNVEEAVRTFQMHDVHLVISDIGLPDGTGHDVLARVHAIRAVPVIALSGYGMEEDIARSRAAGFADHLTKPIDWPSLETTLIRLLAPLPCGAEFAGAD